MSATVNIFNGTYSAVGFYFIIGMSKRWHLRGTVLRLLLLIRGTSNLWSVWIVKLSRPYR